MSPAAFAPRACVPVIPANKGALEKIRRMVASASRGWRPDSRYAIGRAAARIG